ADDRIEDKHPVYDPSLTTDEVFDSCKVHLNKSASVTRLDIVPFDAADATIGKTLYRDVPAAAAAITRYPVLPSMEVVNQSLKAFNDGLYAAIELGVERGLDGSPIDKLTWLTDLATALDVRAKGGTTAERPLAADAERYVAAALTLGGGMPPAGVDATDLVTTFRTDSILSRPIGFYTWTPELSAIFEQDRFLQNHGGPMSFGAQAATAVVLHDTPDLDARYGRILDLYAGLTNPFHDYSTRDLEPFAQGAGSLAQLDVMRGAFVGAHPNAALDGSNSTCVEAIALFPASDSPENRLLRSLACPDGVLPAGNILDLLVSRIRSGALDLTPTPTSGFYDRQLYALETLLTPDRAAEKDHLFLTRTYKQKLVDTFKSILIETRETHIKQLEVFGSELISAKVEVPTVDVYPQFPVEPFPTFYLRAARAYTFLSILLRSVLGDAFLDATHRVGDGDTRGTLSLTAELHDKTSLLYGLHLATSAALGMRDAMTAEEKAAFPVAQAQDDAAAYATGWAATPDVAYDPRVIVPVAMDFDTGTATYWAVLGVRPVLSVADFYPGFEPRDVTSLNCTVGKFVEHRSVLFTLANVQVTTSLAAPPLTRDELRAICDANVTEDAIVAAIERR
ncbi:MAG TPA: hypothetical protein VF316_04985, partial [Polyangiaceae bacterium]